MPTNEMDINTLPRWAQKEIRSLRAQLDQAEDRNKEYRKMIRLRRQAAEAEAYAREALLTVSDPSTKIFLAHYERPDTPLPPDARVLFKFEGGAGLEVTIHDSREGSIAVRGDGFGMGALGCYPEATNMVRVGVTPR